MSDLSLSEISKLAVIDLPLWPQDLWNPEYYETNIQPYEDDTDLDALQEIGSIAKPLPGLKQLLFAILDGNVDDVKDLLDGGISLTGTDRLGKAPLHWAAQSGSVEMVKLLLESGAEINAQSPEFGFTPLHCAVHIDDDKIAALFLDYGADIEARDNNGMTPLAVAAHMKHFNCARMLVERGANMLATENKNGSTPLHLAAKSGSKPIAGLLLEKGVSPLVVDNSKWITPKTYATINRDKEMRQLLSKYRSKGQVKSILSNSVSSSNKN